MKTKGRINSGEDHFSLSGTIYMLLFCRAKCKTKTDQFIVHKHFLQILRNTLLKGI